VEVDRLWREDRGVLFSARGCLAVALLLASLALAGRPAEPPPEPTATTEARSPSPRPPEDENSERPVKPASQAPADQDKEKKPAPSAPPPAVNRLEALKVPPEAIIVVCDALAEAMRLVPSAVVLRPEKYRELQDQIEKLKAQVAQLTADRPVAPSTCQLAGKVEGDLVNLKAQFVFATERPNVAVYLACGQAQIANPTIDDRPAQIRYETDGWAVQVDKPGDHRLTLDLALKLQPRAVGRGLELDLPRAASTSLELDLPPQVKEKDLRVGDQGLAGTLLTYKGHQLSGLLGGADRRGPADRLDLSWKGADPAPGLAPDLVAEGRIQVHLDSQQTITEAELTLKVRAGRTDQWRLLLPAGAEAKVAPADQGRVKDILSEDVVDGKKVKIATQKTILLNEAEADPLVVLVTVTGPALRPGAAVAVGPFLVRDAFPQSGSVVVSNAVADLRPRFQPRGSIAPRDLTEEERRRNAVTAFHYWRLPAVKDLRQVAPASLALLVVEGERVQGQIETRVAHTLTLAPDSADGDQLWRVVTVIDAKPVRNEVDHLDVLIPPEWVYEEKRSPGAPERVRGVEFDATRGVVRFLLARSPADALKPFQVTVEGRQRQRTSPSGRAALQLPRPLETLDAGGQGPGHQITVRAGKGVELIAPERGNLALEAVSRETHEQTWKTRRLPQQIEVEWHPYRPEVQAEGVVDLTLSPREGHVRHALWLRFPQEPLAQIPLHVPEALADHIRVVEGGAPVEGPLRPGVRQVRLNEPVGKEHSLVLEYSFALPDRGKAGAAEPVTMPLVTLDGVGGETKLRVGGDPGLVPALAGGPWQEANVEEVKGWSRLPVLVARCPHLDQQPTLRLGEPAGSTAAVLIDRVLVRVVVLADGSQSYRSSFLISQLAGRSLDVELPARVLNLGPRVTLDGIGVAGVAVDEAGQRTEGGRILRLNLPEVGGRAAVLELTYQVPAVKTSTGFLQSVLSPPVVRGDPGATPVRWQISLPAGWVPLGPEAGPGIGRTWAWHGWLFAPGLAVTSADLDRWFTGAESPREEEGETIVPSLVCWRSGLEPLTVVYAPQQAWLMVCSLGLLLVGFALYLLARPRELGRGLSTAWLMPALTALVLAGAVVGLLWPTALSAVALGCEPGAAVLLAFAAVQWLLHVRYRRQIVFLPSFSRGRSGSSLLRPNGSAQRPRAEPSTVDAPPYTGSSLWPSGEAGPPAPPGSQARRPEPGGGA
jgi:hypothetical protein